MRDHVRFHVNGQPRTVSGGDAFASLSDYLRGNCGLAGTKVVCAEGDCGACTVLVGRPHSDSLKYVTVDSCIQFLYQLDGTHVVTVEGLAEGDTPHPVQQAMVSCHGSQCGYCTPGFVMALAGWAEEGAASDVRTTLTGNLCRCTGYVPILEAAASLKRMPLPRLAERPNTAGLRNELTAWQSEPLQLTDGRRTFFAPTTLSDALAFKAAHPESVIVSGGTELGVLRNKRGDDPTTLVSLKRIANLNGIDVDTGRRVTIGANATWTEIEREVVPHLLAFGPIVRRFGSPQIRNVATLAGNIINGSPIADSLPLLMVLDAEVTLAGPKGVRRRPLNGFYTGYKKKDLAPDEILTQVTFALPSPADRLRCYKVSRRTDLDIATFGAAIRIRMTGDVIEQAAIAFSGVAATVVRLSKAEAFLIGKQFTEATFREAGMIARSEVTPLSDVRGGKDYRGELAAIVLLKFFHEATAS
ncbi:xanthine dehydrogenase small subunit [soil metagenome]